MKVNFTIDLEPEAIAELSDQLPAQDFGRLKELIDGRARTRFKSVMQKARREFRKRGLVRADFDRALADVRGKK